MNHSFRRNGSFELILTHGLLQSAGVCDDAVYFGSSDHVGFEMNYFALNMHNGLTMPLEDRRKQNVEMKNPQESKILKGLSLVRKTGLEPA